MSFSISSRLLVQCGILFYFALSSRILVCRWTRVLLFVLSVSEMFILLGYLYRRTKWRLVSGSSSQSFAALSTDVNYLSPCQVRSS